MEQEIKEFKVFNKNIEQVSIYYGFFLIIWGVIVSFISGSSSFTSYIPSYIGLIILVFSFLSIKFFRKKKIFMHLVASFGLVTFLGGLDFVRLTLKGSFFENFWADISTTKTNFKWVPKNTIKTGIDKMLKKFVIEND